jgi:hypothetical protein
MKVSIIFEDNTICIDGKSITFDGGEVVPAQENYQAMQWEDTCGYIQIHRSEPIFFKDFSIVEPYIEQFREKEKQG